MARPVMAWRSRLGAERQGKASHGLARQARNERNPSVSDHFKWESGRGYRVPADLVGEIVEKIEAAEGVCHPARLVEEARGEESPIHDLFEWRDDVAAERYRVDQARRVLRSLRVVTEHVEVKSPAFVHVRHVTDEGVTDGYMSTLTAMANEVTKAGVLGDALRQLNGLRHRYELLAELKPVWQALDAVTSDEKTDA